MRKDDLQDALGLIDDQLVDRAERMRQGAYKKKNQRRKWVKGLETLAACLCLCVVGYAVAYGPIGMRKATSGDSAVMELESEPLLEGSADGLAAGANDEGTAAPMEPFMIAGAETDIWDGSTLSQGSSTAKGQNSGPLISSGEFETTSKNNLNFGGQSLWTGLFTALLKGESQNQIISPVNLFACLEMYGEVSSAQNQSEILDLFGFSSMEEMRAQNGILWQETLCDNEDTSAQMANSLWLNDDISYDEELLQDLAMTSYLSSYVGTKGDSAYDDLYRSWLNENTHELLSELVSASSLSPYGVTLASTLYYKTSWQTIFNESGTKQQTFHSPDGDVDTAFMTNVQEVPYVKGDDYQAICLSTTGGAGMWIILPKEGVSVDSLLKDSTVLSLLQGIAPDAVDTCVTVEIPKFDVTSESDFLSDLGLSDILYPDGAVIDTDGTHQDGIPLELLQAVRLKVDEAGLEGAAMVVTKGGFVEQKPVVTFTADRPFLFSLVTEAGVPLFTGVISNPAD